MNQEAPAGYGRSVGDEVDFEASAECDLDGDGIPCLYRANSQTRSWLVTDHDVY